MNRMIPPVAAALAVASLATASSGVARAAGPLGRSARPALPHDVITYEERMPNGALIGSGLTMFGFSYFPSVVVAAASERPGDKALYVPVVGPWMNLAQRDDRCFYGRCSGDVGNKVLLVADGIFQGMGALQILGGFVFPTTRTVTQAASVRVLPTIGQTQVGLTAIGRF